MRAVSQQIQDVASQHVENTQRTMALEADVDERNLGILESVRQYPWACAWCIFSIWCMVLVGFDAQAAGAVVGIPEFRKDSGTLMKGVMYLRHIGSPCSMLLQSRRELSSTGCQWIPLMVSSATISSLLGAQLADMFGRKKVLIGALFISYGAVAAEFVATTNAVFFVGKLLNGCMIGTLATIMITYIGEVCPGALLRWLAVSNATPQRSLLLHCVVFLRAVLGWRTDLVPCSPSSSSTTLERLHPHGRTVPSSCASSELRE